MLEKIGYPRKYAGRWFKNYLDCRTYRVKICNKHCKEVAIKCGVPQGSKPDLILFIMYANEMIRALKGNSTFAYVDDSALMVADKNVEISVMRDQLNTAAKWCHDNGLVINATKKKLSI